MNRRDFLSFLSVAPVAVPMAAQAVAAKSQALLWRMVPGEFIVGGFDGGSLSRGYGETILDNSDGDFLSAAPYRDIGRVDLRYGSGRALTVAQQFDADLALLSDEHESQLRDTAEPQAPVSPDNQNEIPTAQADDLCHFGQDTETLSPNVSRRLLRAWGVNEEAGA